MLRTAVEGGTTGILSLPDSRVSEQVLRGVVARTGLDTPQPSGLADEIPTRFLHDCRRTAARNLIRASVPERVAMLLTGHKTRAIFDRYNIINEQELLEAGDQLVEYLAQQARTPCGRSHPVGIAAPRTAPPLRLVRRTTA